MKQTTHLARRPAATQALGVDAATPTHFRRASQRVPATWGLYRADGESITLARLVVGLPQATLAEALARGLGTHFPQPYLSLIEASGGYISRRAAEVIASALTTHLDASPAARVRLERLGVLPSGPFAWWQFVIPTDRGNVGPGASAAGAASGMGTRAPNSQPRQRRARRAS